MAKQTDDLQAVRAVTAALGGFSPEEQERILRWAREKLGLAPGGQVLPNQQVPRPDSVEIQPSRAESPEGGQSVSPARDLKSFVTSKNPRNDIQFAATVAYYYRFEAPPDQRRNEIDAALLQDACRLVGRERFKVPRMTLNNAKNQGLLDKGSEAGQFAINTVGENLVAMTLPAQSDGVTRNKKKPDKRSRKFGKKNKISSAKK